MCCGRDQRTGRNERAVPRKEGPIASADTFIAAAQPRYLVVARQTSTDGKRFSTLDKAQDYARRSGGIVRRL